MYTADIDIGGTFTDGFFTRGDVARRSKVLTTPHDLTECFLSCLREGAGAFGVGLKDLLRQATVVRLSTTLGTNTLLQRRGPKIGLIVTAGHEGDLYANGGAQAAVLGLFLAPEMVVGIHERVDPDGRSIGEPEPGEVLAAVRRLVNLGARLIAVSLAESWRNPRHEQRVREVVTERYPQHYLRSIPLQLSHEVSWAANDHTRTNTTVLNAYLHTELARGLFRAEDLAREEGMPHPLLIVHASGGCARVAKTVAVQTLSSGPAAAISGAVALARQLGLERVVTADMGGTSLDVAILDGAEPPFASAPRVSGIELALPMIQTTSIGAGGGSIARLVDGRVQVGPESAGSAPGPACYDKGGLEPTVTDANLVLGFLDADRFLNGRMRLNRKRAEDALTRRLARPLGASLEEVASTVRAGIDGRMAADIAARIRDHGLEPAEVVLFAFGGGGPLHGCAIAEQIGIRRVIGFPFGSVFSAFGSSTADVRHLYYRPLSDGAAAEDGAATALETLRQQAAVDMRGEGFADGAVTLTDRVESRPSEPRTLVLDARAPVPHWLPSPAQAAGASRPEAHERRAVRWSAEDLAETPLYRLDDLVHGAVFDGPALVEAPDTSYAVPRGWTARLDAWGNLTMERAR